MFGLISYAHWRNRNNKSPVHAVSFPLITFLNDMTFVYLHGFNSDGEGWKAEALRRQFPAANVWAPDLPANPEQVITIIGDYLSQLSDPCILLGTSLGGFYAYWASAHFGNRALLFNPSLSPHDTLRGRGIGHFKTWTKGRDYHFKAEYLPVLEQLKVTADTTIRQDLLHFFLATNDDVLNHEPVPLLFPKAQIHWYEGAGHGFSKFEKVLKELKKANLFAE